jgi:metallo-beta-lactamase family protein
MVKLSFHGASQEVTGSCHLIEIAGLRILVDCGLFQGSREIAEDNAEDFGFDARSIDLVLLTHAHLDHCGRLPLLVRRGFEGDIICTAATQELARIVLLDAAHLQEEEAERQAHRALRRGEQRRLALYGMHDALRTIGHFRRTASYGEKLELASGLTATFHDAGHILGSASIRLELARGPGKAPWSITFSGDLGKSNRPVLRDPQVPPKSDVVVMETTYGDRVHRSLADSVEELVTAVRETLQRGGNVLIPSFALERTQEVLFHLREAIERGALPRHLPVFVDSPMAISATEVFERHPECYDKATRRLLDQGIDPFDLPGLRFSRSTEESMALNRIRGGAVIIAGAGMCTGGRIRHHLRHNLWRADSSVIFVGFATQGTLARKLIDGARSVELFGETVAVHASLHTINGFSAHADRNELLRWHKALLPGKTILVHGDPEAMESFAAQLSDTEVLMPRRGTQITLPG